MTIDKLLKVYLTIETLKPCVIYLLRLLLSEKRS